MARGYSEAQNKATQKYIKNAYDEIKVRVPKGTKEEIQKHADSMNESMNVFIKRAINETMKRDIEERGTEWKD